MSPLRTLSSEVISTGTCTQPGYGVARPGRADHGSEAPHHHLADRPFEPVTTMMPLSVSMVLPAVIVRTLCSERGSTRVDAGHAFRRLVRSSGPDARTFQRPSRGARARSRPKYWPAQVKNSRANTNT